MIITNDRTTMIGFAVQRVQAGLPVAGLIVTTLQQSIGRTIDDVFLIAVCMTEPEIRDQVVVYLPL